MKKRLLIAALVLVLVAGLISGCGAKAAFKDGTYKATYDNFDSHGWKAFAEVTVAGGKITDSKFDYVDKDNKLKSQDAQYNEQMKSKSGTNPAEYTVALSKKLVETQDIAKVDAVTGATTSSNNFKTLAGAAIEKAKKGDTSETVLPLPKE